jgi:hypothetical protein
MDGTASRGSESTYARSDHIHPADTNKQDKITASGILKGDGSGGVSAAAAGTDYLTPATNYSPLKQITNSNYSIAATDIGKTICPEYTALHNVNATVTLPQEVSTQFPTGTEIAFFWKDSSYLHLAFSGGIKTAKAGDETYSQNAVYNITERFSIVGIKKVGSASQGDWWIMQGNVEVVS